MICVSRKRKSFEPVTNVLANLYEPETLILIRNSHFKLTTVFVRYARVCKVVRVEHFNSSSYKKAAFLNIVFRA